MPKRSPLMLRASFQVRAKRKRGESRAASWMTVTRPNKSAGLGGHAPDNRVHVGTDTVLSHGMLTGGAGAGRSALAAD